MIEFSSNAGKMYCELITIQETPFIFCSTMKDVQNAITQIYPVRYYSIEKALFEFINHTNKIYENR